MNNKYPEEANKKWWLDEYDKLSYVNIHGLKGFFLLNFPFFFVPKPNHKK